ACARAGGGAVLVMAGAARRGDARDAHGRRWRGLWRGRAGAVRPRMARAVPPQGGPPASHLSAPTPLAHDPEKWIPVFGKDHAPPINQSEMPIRRKGISL